MASGSGLYTADGIELKDGMEIYYRWPIKKDLYKYKYTSSHGKWNLETDANNKGKVISSLLAGKTEYMYASKTAFFEKYSILLVKNKK